MENQNFFSDDRKPGFLRRISKSLKIITIGILVLLSFIPMSMIRELINERYDLESGAIREVSEKWSGRQTVVGPYLNFKYIALQTSVENGKEIATTVVKNLTLLPDDLNINAKLTTETRKRNIYEVNVYNSIITMEGSFNPAELKKQGINIDDIRFNNATLCLGIADMRGIGEQIKISLGDSIYDFDPGLNGKELATTSGVSKVVDIPELKEKVIPFKVELKLKGSQAMYFIPLGKTTKVFMEADWGTPSFVGKYLPEKHEITNESFTANWQVLNLNRSFSQVFVNNSPRNEIENSDFGVNLKVPVEQYQQSMRTAKYAILIILLTFTVIFFVEILDKKRIHTLQYLLIGLALCLFYALLLSLSEQMVFGLAYIIASGLTIGLIGLYIRGIMKSWRPAFVMIGLLTALYTYIYILIQLETLALLAGSLGLFVIQAILMYFSKKIDWFNE
ncbi:cell envelope integrity protein CreD [Bacteroides sp. 519]|uniref:cell envelope integrity protein CreD n=1 Tax=Bacteroides sp. 519 TaxID=2302937 RepID=UPI0013D7B5B4|nr:cell envelope integrity protein CreD [Bacteroides sp. 519]NDV59371.1 cell envelope integrity protein CreD [Bacteroides sp. 519]